MMRERSRRAMGATLLAWVLHSAASGAAETVGEEFAFASGSDRIAGSIFVPDGEGPFPAVVYVGGAGAASYRRYWEGSPSGYMESGLKDWLVVRGYAFVLVDKPGVGRSTGDWRKQSFNERTRDTMGAVRYLAARPDIQRDRIGVMGHSQGGWVAVQAATDHPQEISFVVLLAGPGIGVRRQVNEEMARRWRCESSGMIGLRRFGLATGLAAMSVTGRVVPTGFLSRIVDFDPAPRFERMHQPVLALFGTNDWMVEHESNVERMSAHFGRRSGNDALFIHVVEGGNHWFGTGGGCPADRAVREFLPAFWRALGDDAFWQSAAAR